MKRSIRSLIKKAKRNCEKNKKTVTFIIQTEKTGVFQPGNQLKRRVDGLLRFFKKDCAR